MRIILSLIIMITTSLSVWGSTPRTLRGTVSDPDGNPLVGAMVKLVVDNRTKSFARSASDGAWSLKIPALPDTVTPVLTVEHLSYASLTLPLPDSDTPMEVNMSQGRTLREVTVTAPSLTVRGDTLSFNLASFMSQGDVTLEDALRKVPGITVGSTGAISYLGKDISNFYIEGLEMLGGRYSLATRNIPAEYVSNVEVLSNHQDLKKDKGKLSDKVALNIRLKSKVKFKPVGTLEANLGYGNKTPLHYWGASLMMFNPGFQALLSAKYGNLHEISRFENTVHFTVYGDMNRSASLAESVIGSLSGNTPPLPSKRYLHPHDLNTSLNAVKKLGEDGTFTANAIYSFTKSHYDYSSSATYFTGETPITVYQRMTPHSSVHKPSLSLEYKLNSPTTYRRNRLTAEAEISDRDIVTLLPEASMTQRRKAHTVRLSNVFDNTVRNETHEWHLSSGVSYTMTPSAWVGATGDEAADFHQTAESRTFNIRQNAHTSFIRRNTEIYLPITVRYLYSDLRTSLTSPVVTEHFKSGLNRAYYNDFAASVSPSVEYKSKDGRYSLRFNLPVSLRLLTGHNAVTSNSFRSLRPYADPAVSLIYNLNPKSSLTFNASISTSAGDALDLLDSPVQTTWRTVETRSGLIARSTIRSARLRYDFKLPFDYLFFNASAGYMSTSSNLMTDQTVTPEYNILTTIISPLYSRSFNCDFKLTKTVGAIASKFTLGGTLSHSSSRMIQQQIPVAYRTLTWSLTPTLQLRPWRPMETNLSATYSASRSSYLGASSTMSSINCNGTFTFYITPRLHIIPSAEYTRRRLPDSSYKNMTIFDTAVRLKLRNIALTLSLDNLLNTRSYTYTIFSGLDTYTYSYALRGRSISIGVRLTR
ncbi:MAG: TonB-dependent receptor [Bacteroides sp.]|nr:TonB-dependent receptor [Bacteroides sp.]